MSVDKLWDKYYSLTPYHYSHNNPVCRLDNNGYSDIIINVIRRIETEKSTIGELFITNTKNDKQLEGYTLELPDRNNAKGKSRIKQDSYKSKRDKSQKLGEVIRIEDKHGRENVLFHTGNSPEDTQGCILVGTSYEKDKVTNSKNMMEKVINYIDNIKNIDNKNGEKTTITTLIFNPKTASETFQDSKK